MAQVWSAGHRQRWSAISCTRNRIAISKSDRSMVALKTTQLCVRCYTNWNVPDIHTELRVRFWSDSLELLQPSIDAVQFIGVGVAWVADLLVITLRQLISSNCQLLSSSCQLLSMCQIGYNVEAYDMIYWTCELLQIDVMHECMHACMWMLHESYCPRYVYLGFHVFLLSRKRMHYFLRLLFAFTFWRRIFEIE